MIIPHKTHKEENTDSNLARHAHIQVQTHGENLKTPRRDGYKTLRRAHGGYITQIRKEKYTYLNRIEEGQHSVRPPRQGDSTTFISRGDHKTLKRGDDNVLRYPSRIECEERKN